MGPEAALIKGGAAVALLAFLAGCSTTPDALEANSNVTSKAYTESYPETYRRLVDNARRCLTGHDINIASMLVDADLHQELGFGEVRFAVAGILYSNYFASAKIEKWGNGSRVSVKVNNPLIGERYSNMIFRWAGGDQKC